jgi:serine/threonine protein kinase/predicted ATPase
MAASDHPIPSQIGRYRILRRLGAGGMAEVFLAGSTGAEGVEKILVLKRVLPTYARNARFVSMFVDEAKVSMRLNHPNVVQIFAFEQVKDEFLLAMEFVDGLDLGKLIDHLHALEITMPYGVAAYCALEVAKGLDYAHNRRDEQGLSLDIVHCDISPHNVLLSYEGAVKVTDFGIARARLVTQNMDTIRGKFSYMSPEQAQGLRVDKRSDVYSLGMMLGEMLTGKPLRRDDQTLSNTKLIERARQGQVTLPKEIDPHVPDELNEIVRAATTIDRNERTRTARAMAQALSQFLHAQKEVHDATALERLIGQVRPREILDHHTPPAMASRVTQLTKVSAPNVSSRQIRERRHVVVVAGKVTISAAQHDQASLVQMLESLAYKSDAVLSWQGSAGVDLQFRFLLGLGQASIHDPLQAVRLALDVVDAVGGLYQGDQRSAAVHTDEHPSPEVSVGISRGTLATVRDPSHRLLHHKAADAGIQLAEALSSAAEPGEVLVTGEVVRWARQLFAFEDHGEVQSGELIFRSYRFLRPLTQQERHEDRAFVAERSSLIGREEELALIVGSYREVLQRRRSRAIAVTGDLGTGKSALVSAAMQQMNPPPRVLRTECTFGTSQLPFATTAELVREACGIAPDASDETARNQLRQTVHAFLTSDDERAQVLPWLEPIVVQSTQHGTQPDLDDQSRHDQDRGVFVTRALRLFLRALSQRGPLLVMVDALQWADSSSLDALASILSRTYDFPILIVLVTRPEHRVERAISYVERIVVRELGEPSARALIRSRCGEAQLPSELEDAVYERSGGNPFFIIELIEALFERGAIEIVSDPVQGYWVRQVSTDFVWPSTLQDVVAARLRELGDEPLRVLKWLAVAGAGFRAQDLKELHEVGEHVDDAVQACIERALLERKADHTLGFQNAIVRHEAYEMIDSGERTRMHQVVGQYMVDRQERYAPARIARHLEHAGEFLRAADEYVRAAVSARRTYANRDALRFYSRALRLLPTTDPKRFSIYEAREHIFRVMGRRREQRAELERMREWSEETKQSAELAVTSNRMARYLLDGRQTQGVDRLLEKALTHATHAGRLDAHIEALYLSARLNRGLADIHQGLEACEKALALTGLQPEFLGLRGLVLIQQSVLLRGLGKLADALEAIAEAVAIFHRTGAKGHEAQAMNSMGKTLAMAGQLQDAIVMLRTSIVLDRQIGDLVHLGVKLCNMGTLYAEFGDMDISFRLFRRALDVLQIFDDEPGRGQVLCAMAELKIQEGLDLDEAEQWLDQARDIIERTGDSHPMARHEVLRSELEFVKRRYELAENHAKQAVYLAAATRTVGYELLALTLQACATAEIGRHGEALSLANRVFDEMQQHEAIPQSEKIYLYLARCFEVLKQKEARDDVLRMARALVQPRLDNLRDPVLKHRYRSSGVVRQLLEPAAP